MCIIAIKHKEKSMFSDEIIQTMFENNSHGAGLMYKKKNGDVHIEKGFFKVEDLLKYVHKNYKLLNSTDVVMHFRIATSGKKDALGCHPYPVWENNTKSSCDVKMAMCHNGMLDGFGWKGNDEINDTQVFIQECIKQLPHSFIRNKAILNLIAKSIGTNKLAFMNQDGIKTIGNFIEDDGYYFSNTSYKSYRYHASSSYGKTYTPKSTVTVVDNRSTTVKQLSLFSNETKKTAEQQRKELQKIIISYLKEKKGIYRKTHIPLDVARKLEALARESFRYNSSLSDNRHHYYYDDDFLYEFSKSGDMSKNYKCYIQVTDLFTEHNDVDDISYYDIDADEEVLDYNNGFGVNYSFKN